MTVEEAVTALMVGAVAFIITWRHTPWVLVRLEKAGLKAKDMYKEGTPEIPTKGGIAQVLAGAITLMGLPVLAVAVSALAEVFLGYDVNSTLFYGSAIDALAILVVLLYAMFGLADDFLRFSHPLKLIIPLVAALPLTRAITAQDWVTPFGSFPLSGSSDLWGISGFQWTLIATFVVLPIYVMVVTNLVNMHSGFNGLQTGLSLILLVGFTAKMAIDGRDLLAIAPVFAGVCAGFLIYNRYPARVFEGNVGALAIGAVVGCVIIANGYYMAGIVAMFPHIVNFVMYVIWWAMRTLRPDDSNFKLAKFGRVRGDGTIEVPNILTLKWVLPFYRTTGEKGATWVMWAVSLVCMALALPIQA